MTAQASGAPPDAAFCQLVTEQFGLSMPVRYDPDGVTQSELGLRPNSGELVLTQGNVIETKTWGAHAAVPDTLAGIFGF